MVEDGQYLYLDPLPRTTSAAEHLTTESYSEILSANNGPFRVIGVTTTTVTTDNESILNTISVSWPTVTPSAKKTPTENNRMQTNYQEAKREETRAGYRRRKTKILLTNRENAPIIA